MHNRSDQLAKNILRESLSLISTSETEVELLAATQKIDVYSAPLAHQEGEPFPALMPVGGRPPPRSPLAETHSRPSHLR